MAGHVDVERLHLDAPAHALDRGARHVAVEGSPVLVADTRHSGAARRGSRALATSDGKGTIRARPLLGVVMSPSYRARRTGSSRRSRLTSFQRSSMSSPIRRPARKATTKNGCHSDSKFSTAPRNVWVWPAETPSGEALLDCKAEQRPEGPENGVHSPGGALAEEVGGEIGDRGCRHRGHLQSPSAGRTWCPGASTGSIPSSNASLLAGAAERTRQRAVGRSAPRCACRRCLRGVRHAARVPRPSLHAQCWSALVVGS